MRFPNEAQLVGSLLLVEGTDRTIVIDPEVGSLTEACEIMLDLRNLAKAYKGITVSPIVRKRLKV